MGCVYSWTSWMNRPQSYVDLQDSVTDLSILALCDSDV
jgi:hypothetical protein